MAGRRAKTGDGQKAGGHEAEEQRVRALEARLDAVRAIGAVMASSVGLDALFRQVVPHVSRLLDAERSTLFLLDSATDEIWSKMAEGEERREIRLKLGQGIAGTVAKSREAALIDDAYSSPLFNRDIDLRTGFKTRTVAAVPVSARNGDLVGVLQVLNKRRGCFDADDLGLLETMAVQMAYAVENARQAQILLDQNAELDAASQRAERRRAELDLLYHLEQESNASQDLDALLDSVIRQACDRLRSEAGSVLLADQASGRLFFRAAVGESAVELKEISLAPGEGVVGWVAENRRPLVVNRAEDDLRHDRDLAERVGFPAHALLAVPLIWNNRVIGAVEVLNPRPRSTGAVGYDEEDVKILTLIAAQVARAVALARERQARLDTERMAFIGQLLAGVAHDLRNPMTVISGYAQIMAMEEDADLRQTRCDKVLAQIDDMTAMITDLLAFARGESTLKPAVVDVQELGATVRENLEVYTQPRGIELAVQAEGGAAFVDVGRVKRIVNNLAKNALDVLPRAGTLGIELRAHERGLKLSVADNGPGIPDKVRARLFDPFVTANKVGGTGLGLSIVKRFVDDHGGSIQVESVAGTGTTFHVDLPAAPIGQGEPS